MRTAAVWSAVADLVDRRRAELGRPLRVLDLGGGTGGLAVPLAELGHDVLVVDPSPDALAALRRRTGDSDVAARVRAVQGDADSLAEVTEPASVDLVCCHGVLEVVDDPDATLAAVHTALAPGGALSLLVAGRLAVVLAKVVAGDIPAATAVLTSTDGRWGAADPLPRRFDTDTVLALLRRRSFTADRVHGVRLFSDLVPATVVDNAADRAALLALEEAASSHPNYALLGQLGAGLHVLASRV
ncbi:MAG: methyltransferase domain-containing protein [Actinomycetales bacterium]|nr:methyltransferase domain-containing protein [Candidatus Lutibacillus vidarii]